jgi:hypothetical protein
MSSWWLLPTEAIVSIWLGAAIGVLVGALMAAAANGGAPVSGQSSILLRTLADLGEHFGADDRPRIPDFDPLLEALRLHHGPDGRADEAPQLAAARTLLKEHNLAVYRRLATS